MHNKSIAVIGGGFCGMMTAVYLLQSPQPLDITIINDGYPFGRGVAYSAHTDKYLLNVRAINMSAFDDERFHFLDWLQQQPAYQKIPRNILVNVYAPRKLYGNYLQHIWQQALQNKNAATNINIIEKQAIDIKEQIDGVNIYFNDNKKMYANLVVLATGNTAPRHVFNQNKEFLNSEKYFANPWAKECVSNVRHLKNILIVGNGLTMIDTVQGLLENGFKGKLYTISPNGFKLIPHKYNLLVYEKIAEELPEEYNLREIFILVRNHIRSLTNVGIGAHLVIDALRPYTQQIWQGLSFDEKKYFVKRLSHAWTILRHRIPVHIYEMIQQQRMNGSMETIAGKITAITETADNITVKYSNHKSQKEEEIIVQRVINCTGPECDVRRSANELLRNLAASGLIIPDALHLGIEADAETGAVINRDGEKSERIFTTGGNLKGILWENTAVPDIRVHVKKLASHLSAKLQQQAIY
ncbi:MAG: FAD/NAD(P)-binding protein [Parafilimonas sp.]|nr:FAD/NAD(P)-binding protein [Parafilimonas sp.]